MSTKLVFGWSIDYNDLINFLEKNRAGSCKNTKCTCGPECWNNINYTFPKDVYFIQASNYATSESEFDFAISLLPIKEYYNIEDILNCIDTLKIARKIVFDIGINSEKPTIFALLNI